MIVGGLAVFGVVFALNSAVHSYLILDYTDGDKVALNVAGFAPGALVGLGWQIDKQSSATVHLLGDAALDKYSFTRDAYLQRRRSDVYDGNPPDDGAGKD